MIGRITIRATSIGRRMGFTLVELLVVVVIIAILAALVLGALNSARQTARASKTKSTIVKINDLIMDQYDSYRTRRVPISTSGMTPQQAAAARLKAIRYIMQMEMPDGKSDIITNPTTSGLTGLSRPALNWRYNNRITSKPLGDDYISAECLYMVVTTRNPEARELFAENEVGDADQDGNPEFLDGWGNPISFIRWPAGFLTTYNADTGLQTGDAMNDHDPFDPLKTDAGAYRLIPLIYSAGPDGIYDIWWFNTGTVNPYEKNTTRYRGMPWDRDTNLSVTASGSKDGDLDHFDNIHNHRIEGR